MYGTSKVGSDDSEQLLAADVALVATGVSKEASTQQLKEFIEGKGIGVISVEKLTREDVDTRTNTFKVVIKLSDYEKAMMPEIWPYRVGVRHYRPPRRQQGPSWEQQTRQSQQTGRQSQQQNRQQSNQRPTPQQLRSQEPSPFSLEVHNRFQPLAEHNGEEVFMPN